MTNLILCADSSCLRKDTCRRFITNPLNEIWEKHATRIKATLKGSEEAECSKYEAITLITTKTTTK